MSSFKQELDELCGAIGLAIDLTHYLNANIESMSPEQQEEFHGIWNNIADIELPRKANK